MPIFLADIGDIHYWCNTNMQLAHTLPAFACLAVVILASVYGGCRGTLLNGNLWHQETLGTCELMQLGIDQVSVVLYWCTDVHYVHHYTQMIVIIGTSLNIVGASLNN